MSDSLLCLDPSSSAVGIAYFPALSYRQHPTYIHVIKPGGHHKTAISRIDYIVDGVMATAKERKPSIVVMEYSAGKVAGRFQERPGFGFDPLSRTVFPEKVVPSRNISGLAVMGQAQGEVRRALLCRRGEYSYNVETVDESWTGRVSKVERATVIDVTVPAYREFRLAVGDPGYDAADAVGIGLWYIGKRQQEEMVERGGR